MSLKFVPKGRINNIPALVQIMAWRRPGNKPLSEPMMVSLLTHICVTMPQWVTPSPPRQNGRSFAADIFKCIFMNDKFVFRFEFHQSLFHRVQLTINQHWFRRWLGVEQVRSRYLKQFHPSSLMHICGTRGDELIIYVNSQWYPSP